MKCEIDDLQREIERLNHKIAQLERDNWTLATMDEKARQLREQHSAEKRQQLQHYEMMQQYSPAIVLLFDQDLHLVLCTDAALSLLRGDHRARLAGTPFYKAFSTRIKEEWREKLYLKNRWVLMEKLPYRIDDIMPFADGSYIHAQIAISPVLDGEGKCRGTVMSINDITLLAEARNRAEAASRAKSSFLTNMSNEIRIPMNAVKGLSELLTLTELTTLQRSHVNNILTAANSLLGTINDVQDYSKIDGNQVDLVEEPYYMPEMLAGVCNVINMRRGGKGISISINADPDLPTVLMGDEIRIKQVMTNLLSNAMNYTREGYVRMNLTLEHGEGKAWLVCAVEDSGIGIRKEDLPTLFEAFSSADTDPSRENRGTGLSLAICRRLVLAMGGDIKVSSHYGTGSTFTFRIPQGVVDPKPIAGVRRARDICVALLTSDEVEAQGAEALLKALGVRWINVPDMDALLSTELGMCTHGIFQQSFPKAEGAVVREKLHNCIFAVMQDISMPFRPTELEETILFLPLLITDLSRFLNSTPEGRRGEDSHLPDNTPAGFTLRDTNILVVDDNEINLVVCGEMLRAFCANVLCADSGAEALRLCEEQKFDIIFMDHLMSDMDGIETTREIRRTKGFNQYAPIIAMTANVTADMKGYYMRSGMDDFITKPIDLNRLGRVLYRWLPKEKAVVIVAQESGGEVSNPAGGADLVTMLDDLGLDATGVMEILKGDMMAFAACMEEVKRALPQWMNAVQQAYQGRQWQDFKQCMEELVKVFSTIGAIESVALAKNLSEAADKGGVAEKNYFTLLWNAYALDKKLNVLVPLARGEEGAYPADIAEWLYVSLTELGEALRSRSYGEGMMLLDDLLAHSMNKKLDQALRGLLTALEELDYEEALRYQLEAKEILRRETVQM